MTDAIESVVQGQRRRCQKRKHWDREGDEEEEEEEEGEGDEGEEGLTDREENLGGLGMRSRGGGREGGGEGGVWLTQDEMHCFRR